MPVDPVEPDRPATPAGKAKSYRVLVPGVEDGERTVRRGGFEPVTFRVEAGVAVTSDRDHAQRIAAAVGGTTEEGN